MQLPRRCIQSYACVLVAWSELSRRGGCQVHAAVSKVPLPSAKPPCKCLLGSPDKTVLDMSAGLVALAVSFVLRWHCKVGIMMTVVSSMRQ